MLYRLTFFGDAVLVSFEAEAEWDLFHLGEMRDELMALFGRPVDLVEKEGLRNPFRRRTILARISHKSLVLSGPVVRLLRSRPRLSSAYHTGYASGPPGPAALHPANLPRSEQSVIEASAFQPAQLKFVDSLLPPTSKAS